MFYCPDIKIATVLPEEESQHAIRVLRLQRGDEIEIVDGVGGFYKAKILNPHPKHCEFDVLETYADFGKRNYKLHIAIAPTKNMERLEWFIEKCTEIGIDEITPVYCRYSERKIIKPERLEKIIISAAKQSLKANFPTLNPMIRFQEFINKDETSSKFIAHCYDMDKKPLQQVCKKGEKVVILIGPEGDFSLEEISKALDAGYQAISLGTSRLRTETAGIVACHTLSLLNEK